MDAIPWAQFVNEFKWRQGEHIAAIAPTGAGKTTLMRALIPYRTHSIFFGTKPDDPLYRKLLRDGFRRIESIDDAKPWDTKLLLWPKPKPTIRSTYLTQHKAFTHGLNVAVTQKSWTLWFDECKYMAQMLKMMPEITYCLEQLRATNGTVVSGAQRPVWLPRSVLSNSSHVFLWRTTDREDAKRLSDIGGVDAKQLAAEAQQLSKHEFIYVRTRGVEASMMKSQVGR